ncbi:glycosyltransferase [candidate division KSB1 bacterium]|nr:MAG: glycosyltransferase [candidate division KSB1 bacterium]MCE7940188.1 glycosyltransferase [Chlorobi bacterium CHB1]MDL1873857.1 glycosyltransferase [Cytophagia bacterium CHB2]
MATVHKYCFAKTIGAFAEKIVELMNKAPLVSIVIPCYNYAHFLPEAIESALHQTYANVEILVVDDGSTDNTPGVAAGYKGRVSYHRKPNGGLSQARNYGARLCHGEYVVFLDADNRLEPTFVQECLGMFAVHPNAAFVYTQLRHFGDLNYVTDHPAYDPARLKRGNYIDACSLLKTDLVRHYPYDEKNRTSWEDWDFYLTLAENGFYGVLLNKPLVWYRRHGENMTKKLDPLIKQRLRVSILKRHLRLVGLRMYSQQLWRFYRLVLGRYWRNSLNVMQG